MFENVGEVVCFYGICFYVCVSVCLQVSKKA